MGQNGGIWLLWRSTVGVVSVVVSTDQFIHVTIEMNMKKVNLIVIYAAPSVTQRSGLWGSLKSVIEGVDGPLMVGGDFNTILRLDERTGGNGRLSPDSLAFGEWMNDLTLIDTGFRGSRFTWHRGRSEQTYISKRLDQILCCPHARLKWQESVVTHLPVFASDHAPLYMQLCPVSRGDPKRRPFHFEAAWLKHEGFQEFFSNSWNNQLTTHAALSGLRDRLKRWNREIFGDVNKRKAELRSKIGSVQDLLKVAPTDELLAKEEDLICELDKVLEQEELIWFLEVS
ncbi:PREDICTED: uncharacterized protein LOC104748217 [Camelina sativa]|uniref:Uncharacterized protein LOC104748217 n=1 Tax=Camelina sativa TaxID=90675 RepID=A0ABM0WAQ0_CAMSA|nr:PREDICTED: uncharacterized protein LOC104748217 [Camelina sativa]